MPFGTKIVVRVYESTRCNFIGEMKPVSGKLALLAVMPSYVLANERRVSQQRSSP